MGIQELQSEMNKLSVKHYKDLQSLFRKHSGVLDDRKATLVLMGYMSDFIGLGWPGKDRVKIIEQFLAVQKEMNSKYGKQ